MRCENRLSDSRKAVRFNQGIIMRLIVLAGFATLFASGAYAQDKPSDPAAQTASTASVQAAAIKRRSVLWDKNGVRIGTVLDITPTAAGGVDTIAVLSGENSYRIPGATLSLADSKLITSLTRREATSSR